MDSGNLALPREESERNDETERSKSITVTTGEEKHRGEELGFDHISDIIAISLT